MIKINKRKFPSAFVSYTKHYSTLLMPFSDRSMRILKLIAVIVCFYQSSFSQQGNPVYDINPMSPEAASLFKAVERPIGSFSGTVPLSIQLYTLQSRNITLPIELSYSMGGIKVEEVASAVGLGWSLSAGGCVTRSLVGVADDYYGGFLKTTLKPENFLYEATGADIVSVLNGVMDLEPDIFYFNCNGLSGRFFFNDSGMVVMMDQTGVKIVPVWQNVPGDGTVIMGWVLTDLEGKRYYMGLNRQKTQQAVDYTYNVYYDGMFPGSRTSKEYTSSWHLMEIADMNDVNSIRFEYESSESQFVTRSDAHLMVQAVSTIDCTDEDTYSYEKFVESHINEQHLKNIISDNCIVSFNNLNDRRDYAGGHRLGSIDVKDVENNLKKRISFGYDYFSQPNAPSGSSNDKLYKRLKLTYVTEYASDLQDSLKHNFEYIESINLPSRLSKGIDYWGYYSGRDQNTSVLPNGYYVGWGAQRLSIMQWADRRANPLTSMANSLKKVVFPSGGSREFIYEPNVALVNFYNQIYPDPQYYPYRGFDTFIFGTNPSLPRYQQDFTVNSSNGGAQFYFSLSDGSHVDNFSVKIVRKTSPGIELDYWSSVKELTGSHYLVNGNYRFEFYFNSLSEFFWMEGYWKEETLSNNSITRYGEECRRSNMNVGGIRVKEIKDNDPVQNKTYSTKYRYVIPGDTTLSSGLLITPVRVLHAGECDYARSCHFLQLSSTSAYPLAMQGGSYVYYPEVRTIYEDNGFIDREYSFDFDLYGHDIDINQYPPLPPPSKNWKRGKLLVEKIHDSTGSLLSENTSIYPFIYPSDAEIEPDNEDQLLMKDQYGGRLVGRICLYDPCICYSNYLLTSRFSMPKRSIAIVYTPDGTLKTETEYSYYISEDMPLLKSKRVTMSDNTTHKTYYCYAFNQPADFKLSDGIMSQEVLDTLLVKNYLAPIETRTYSVRNDDSVLVSGRKTWFQYFSSNGIYPYSIQQYFTPTVHADLIFPSYDNKGNILSHSKENNIPISYIWGYNSMYPIAEAKNAAYDEIAYTGFEFAGNVTTEGKWNSPEGLLVTDEVDAPNGKQSLALRYLDGFITADVDLKPTKKYIFSCWERGEPIDEIYANGINIISNRIIKTNASWRLREIVFDGASGWLDVFVGVNADSYLDDLCVYPFDAQITTYTYDPIFGMTSETGVNRLVTRYEYDAFGRLKIIRTEDGSIVKQFDYKYQSLNTQ